MTALKQFISDASGSIALAFGLMIPAIIGAVGLGVDLSKAYLVQDRLGRALDQAALAAAASSSDPDAIEARLNAFFDANFPDAAMGNPLDLDITVTDDDVIVAVQARVDTEFMHLLGRDYVMVEAFTAVRREVRGIEVALVLDNTGSMRGGNIEALRTAAETFVNVIYERTNDPERVKIALVPYAATVNVGSIAESLVDHSYNIPWSLLDPHVPYDPNDGGAWKGCVEERPYPHDIMDTDVATGGYWEQFRWEGHADNKWHTNGIWDDDSLCNDRRTPNLGCPTPITPLTSNQDALLDDIDDLLAWCRGGTLGNVGMAWGWRVLSPEAPFTQGAAYDDAQWRKAVVMMTDGDNLIWRYNVSGNLYDSDYSAYDRIDENVLGTTNRNVAKGVVNDRLAEVCTAMKDEGIEVYTITFTSRIGNDTKEIYRQCASDVSKYYDAPSQNDLISAFEQISKELSNLHIRQ